MNNFTTTVSVLEALRGPSATGGIRSYSYSESFQALWAVIDNVKSGGPLPAVLCGHLHIVWDDGCDLTTPSLFPYSNFLTAYDWAVALSIAIAERVDRDRTLGPPALRVHIFDCTPPAQWTESFGAKLSLGLPGLLPWVSIYQNTSAGRSGLLSALSQEATTTPQTFGAERWKSAARTVRRLWTSELCRAGDRHSVANAVGPIVLSQALAQISPSPRLGPRREGTKDERYYFLRLLETLRLVAPMVEASRLEGDKPLLGGLEVDPLVVGDLYGRFKTLRFMLVDDQAQAGFHQVLAQFLLGSQESETTPTGAMTSISSDDRFKLASFVDPSVLLSWLETTASHRPERWYRPRIFGKRVDHPTEAPKANVGHEFDILFLDLRLHGIANTTEQLNAEQAWARRLLDFFEEYSRDMLDSECGLAEDQRNALNAAVTGAMRVRDGQAADGQVAHLALLPILISVCDPTVPIILFSSTQQRVLLSLFRAFPNIASGFAKPGISGYADEDEASLADSANALRFALREALVLHEKRWLWELLSFTAFGSDPTVDGLPNSPLRTALVEPPCLLTRQGDKVNAKEVMDSSRVSSTPKNISEVTLPFPEDIIFERRFFEIFSDFIVNNIYYESLSKPSDFLEGALLARIRDEGDESRALNFFPVKIQEVVGGKLDPVAAARADCLFELRGVRNRADHGYFAKQDLNVEHLRSNVLSLLVMFLHALMPKLLQKPIEDQIKNSSDFARVTFRKAKLFSWSSVDLDNRYKELMSSTYTIRPFLKKGLEGGVAPLGSGDFGSVKSGSVVQVVVLEPQSSGLLVNVGGVRSFIHKSLIGRSGLDRPKEHFVRGARITARVRRIDPEGQVVSLDMKNWQPAAPIQPRASSVEQS